MLQQRHFPARTALVRRVTGEVTAGIVTAELTLTRALRLKKL